MRLHASLVALGAALVCCAHGETTLPLVNPGFEEGLAGWTVTAFPGVTCEVTEHAATGRLSLHVVDNSNQKGSSVLSSAVSIEGTGVFELRGMYFPVSGSGLGMYVRVYDAAGEVITSERSHLVGLGGEQRRWLPFVQRLYTSTEARSLRIWVTATTRRSLKPISMTYSSWHWGRRL